MEKQGEVRPDITPSEDTGEKRASADVKSVDKLAEEHTTSRLIGSVGKVTQKPKQEPKK